MESSSPMIRPYEGQVKNITVTWRKLKSYRVNASRFYETSGLIQDVLNMANIDDDEITVETDKIPPIDNYVYYIKTRKFKTNTNPFVEVKVSGYFADDSYALEAVRQIFGKRKFLSDEEFETLRGNLSSEVPIPLAYYPIRYATPAMIEKYIRKGGVRDLYVPNFREVINADARPNEDASVDLISSFHRVNDEWLENGLNVTLKDDEILEEEGEGEDIFRTEVVTVVSTYYDGEENGPVMEYYEDGNIYKKYYISSTGINGEHITYFKNGRPSLIRHCIDGRNDGKLQRFYTNGKIFMISNHREGVADGEAITWDMNGKITYVSNGRERQLDGKFTTYYTNEQNSIQEEETYEHDELVGMSYQYDEDGNLLRDYSADTKIRRLYKNGVVYQEMPANGLLD